MMEMEEKELALEQPAVHRVSAWEWGSRILSLVFHPVLLPFYMLYRTCRYLLRSMRGERPGLRKMAAAATERKSLYARLHIYEGKEL